MEAISDMDYLSSDFLFKKVSLDPTICDYNIFVTGIPYVYILYNQNIHIWHAINRIPLNGNFLFLFIFHQSSEILPVLSKLNVHRLVLLTFQIIITEQPISLN